MNNTKTPITEGPETEQVRAALVCTCGVMCQDHGLAGGCRYLRPERAALRKLVDVVYKHATEGETIPATHTADLLIDKAFGSMAPLPSEGAAWRVAVPGGFVGGAFDNEEEANESVAKWWRGKVVPLYASPTPVSGPTNAQMLEYARRLNTIAVDLEVHYRDGDAADLRRIAEQIVLASPVSGEVKSGTMTSEQTASSISTQAEEQVWQWLPIEHRPLQTGHYLVAHRAHEEILHFFGPDKDWVRGTIMGWRRLGKSGWERDDPVKRFGATHCILIQPTPDDSLVLKNEEQSEPVSSPHPPASGEKQ